MPALKFFLDSVVRRSPRVKSMADHRRDFAETVAAIGPDTIPVGGHPDS